MIAGYKKADIADLEAENSVLRAMLEECAEYLNDQSDVVDGDEGHPDPNPAMALLIEVRAVIARAA